MKELLPTGVSPGDRLTAGWVNQVDSMLNRMGQFSPGSTLGGIRSHGFDADIGYPQHILQPFIITGYRRPDGTSVIFPGVIGQPDFTLTFAAYNESTYAAEMIRWDGTRFSSESDGCQNVINDVFNVRLNWQPQQILLPGDLVLAFYDFMEGNFKAVNPPLIRGAKAEDTYRYGDIGNFRLFHNCDNRRQFLPNSPTLLDMHVVVEASIGWGLPRTTVIRQFEDVWIEFVQPLQGWFVIQRPGSARRIEFRLNQNLARTMSSALATPLSLYDGDLVDPSTGELGIEIPIISVHNPDGACPGPHFFFGSAGCHGMAVWHEVFQHYRIWQLECGTPEDVS